MGTPYRDSIDAKSSQALRHRECEGERAAPPPASARGSVRGAGGRGPRICRVLFTWFGFCVACAPSTAHVQTPGSRVFIFIYTASAAEPGCASAPCPRSGSGAPLAPPLATPGRTDVLRPTRRRAGAARLAPSHRHAAARLSHNTTRPYRAPRQCPARSQTMYTWARVGTGAPHAAAPPQLPPTRTPPCGLGLTRSLPREAGGIPRLVLKALVRDRVHEPVAQLRLQARRREAV